MSPKTITPKNSKAIKPSPDRELSLKERAHALGLHGLVAQWDEVDRGQWLEELLAIEESERGRRSLERRIRNAKIGTFKVMNDFEWSWPKSVDRALVEEVLGLGFIEEAANVVLLGPNGVGKSMIAQNVAHRAILAGHTARFVTASDLLNDLGACETTSALQRKLRLYARPSLLLIDEIGYLASTAKHADLLFEVINRRYQQKSIVLTTNKPFSEWNGVFPNAGCVVTLVDRLVHRAEIIQIDGESYRKKEAKERQVAKARARRAKKATTSTKKDK